ncbi:hypothetical protein M5D96_000706, partial [Drosophila gunungcola]
MPRPVVAQELNAVFSRVNIYLIGIFRYIRICMLAHTAN